MLYVPFLKAKNLNLLYRFYLNFSFVSILITFVAMALLHTFGAAAIVMLVWFKIVTMIIFMSYVNSYKQKEFYYYRNLGFSKLKLFSSALTFDLALFSLFMLITYLFL